LPEGLITAKYFPNGNTILADAGSNIKYPLLLATEYTEEYAVSWLVEGTMQNGRTFRPSDWVDRVSGVLAKFGSDHRLRYGAVRPCYVKGKKCLLVQKALEHDDPVAFEYVSTFVRTNGLQMHDLRAGSEDIKETGRSEAVEELGAIA